MLQDNYGRKFEYLRLSITDVCNFSCDYCLPDGYDCSGARDFLSLSEIKTLVTAFAKLGMKKIRITGGEPGLRKDLVDVIRICNNTQGIEQIALTTNGFNLENNIKQWVEAGLTHLNVSADSLDPRLFQAITGHQNLESILRGVDKAISLGLSNVKLNAVLLKTFNLDQIDQYLSWIKNKSVTVRFIELMETGDNKDYFATNHVSGEYIKQDLLAKGWTQVIKGKLAGPAQEFCHPDYQGRFGLIMPYSTDFCKTCNRLRIASNGKLHLCLFAEQGIDLRPYLTEDGVEHTCNALLAAMTNKEVGHELAKNFTGATTHLAMLGG
jgi:cyclic pyranopterin phosphate synthase